MQRGPDRGRGRGQHIQCDLLSTQVATLANVGSNYLNGGQEAKRHGTAHMSIVPYQTFQTGDGWLTLGCGNEGQFRDFSSRIGKEGLAEDEKFSSNERRVKVLMIYPVCFQSGGMKTFDLSDAFDLFQNRIELVDLITSILSTKTNEEWNGIFEGASFPYGAVNDFKSVFQDPQIVYNETVQKISHESLGTVKQVRPAVSYSGSRNEIRGPPPVLGSHTKEVLKDLLGMNEEEVERMEREKIIR